MEVLTLSQTHKLERRIDVVLYGSEYWREIVNFDALVRHGVIDARDLELFEFADDPESALDVLKSKLPRDQAGATPSFAKSATSVTAIGSGPGVLPSSRTP
jgi:predicted Rossmann-fold nucleotide-binding protein